MRGPPFAGRQITRMNNHCRPEFIPKSLFEDFSNEMRNKMSPSDSCALSYRMVTSKYTHAHLAGPVFNNRHNWMPRIGHQDSHLHDSLSKLSSPFLFPNRPPRCRQLPTWPQGVRFSEHHHLIINQICKTVSVFKGDRHRRVLFNKPGEDTIRFSATERQIDGKPTQQRSQLVAPAAQAGSAVAINHCTSSL